MYILRDILGYLVMILPCIMANSRYQKAIRTYHDLKVIQEEKLDDSIAQMMRWYLAASFLGILIVLGAPDGLVLGGLFGVVEAILTVFWTIYVDSGFFNRPKMTSFLKNAYVKSCIDQVHMGVATRKEVVLPDYDTFKESYLQKEETIMEHAKDYWEIDTASKRTFILRITVPRIIFCVLLTMALHYIRITRTL